jgi:hypothetical protein
MLAGPSRLQYQAFGVSTCIANVKRRAPGRKSPNCYSSQARPAAPLIFRSRALAFPPPTICKSDAWPHFFRGIFNLA